MHGSYSPESPTCLPTEWSPSHNLPELGTLKVNVSSESVVGLHPILPGVQVQRYQLGWYQCWRQTMGIGHHLQKRFLQVSDSPNWRLTIQTGLLKSKSHFFQCGLLPGKLKAATIYTLTWEQVPLNSIKLTSLKSTQIVLKEWLQQEFPSSSWAIYFTDQP